MNIRKLTLIFLSLSAAACTRDLPPTDIEIQEAIYDFVTHEDLVDRMRIMRTTGRIEEIMDVEGASKFESLGYESAGCAKSQKSSGFTCTIDVLVKFQRPEDDFLPLEGTKRVAGSLDFYRDATENSLDPGAWKVMRDGGPY